jgi:hypothetical protein
MSRRHPQLEGQGQRDTTSIMCDLPRRLNQAKPSALTVFSVDTSQQAREAIVSFATQRYNGSFRWSDWRVPDQRDWEAITRSMDSVTDTLKEWWAART